VSTGTISRAFNTSPGNRINAVTRDRILKKAREIGYAPHSGARAMIHGRARRWGLLLPHLYNPRYAELMDHLDREARQRSTVLLLGLSRFDPQLEADLLLHWASGEADGIITDCGASHTVYEVLRKRRYPVVFLFGRPSPQFNLVDVDTMRSFRDLPEKMIAAGHRRLGFIGQYFTDCRLHPSFLGYAGALEARGWALNEEHIHFAAHDYVAAAEAWQRWRTSKTRPTAVLCFNDVIACNLIQNARNDGLDVPRDLSVTGSDDIPAAADYHLTTIRTDPAQIAREVFALLERKPSSKAEVRMIQSRVVQRESIGPVNRKKL
jgi:LacI family transcriptional regulator